MKKLRLNVNDLQVASFAANDPDSGEGTVHGYISAICTYQCDTENRTCVGATCDGQYTCNVEYTCARSCGDCGTYYCASGESCNGSCIYSCAVTCDYTGCDSC